MSEKFIVEGLWPNVEGWQHGATCATEAEAKERIETALDLLGSHPSRNEPLPEFRIRRA